MKKIGIINIVGVNYTLYVYNGDFKKINDDANERNKRYLHKDEESPLDGYCDYMSKEIRVFTDEYTDPKYFETTIRHEITHAFLYEIGNSNCDNEEFVDKLSKWVPQLETIYNRCKTIIDLEGIK